MLKKSLRGKVLQMLSDIDLLLLMALPSEAQEILRLWPSLQPVATVKFCKFYRSIDPSIALAITGSGIANATCTLSSLAHLYSIKRYLNIGLAGALAEDLRIGDAFNCTRVLQHDSYVKNGSQFSFLRPGTITFASSEDPAIPYLEPLSPQTIDLPQATLLCGSSFIAEETEKRRIGRYGQLVDMESAGVVQAASLLKLAGTIVKIVADPLIGDSQSSFIELEKMLSKRIAEIAYFILK
jgi:nucleoside phosphorylase